MSSGPYAGGGVRWQKKKEFNLRSSSTMKGEIAALNWWEHHQQKKRFGKKENYVPRYPQSWGKNGREGRELMHQK